MSDQGYSTFPYRLENKGLVARYVSDALPPGTFSQINNLESRAENAIASRLGLAALSTDGTNNLPLGGPIQSISRMRGLDQPFRYAAAAGAMYRRTGDSAGGFTQIANGLSGQRLSMFPYRPNANASPYMFFADDNVLLKDNGALATAQPWGGYPPFIPPTIQIGDPQKTIIEAFEEFNPSVSFTLSNYTVPLGNYYRCLFLYNPATAVTPGLHTVNVPKDTVATLSRTGGIATAVLPRTAAERFQNFADIRIGMKITVENCPDPSFNCSGSIVLTEVALAFSTITFASPGPNVASFDAGASLIGIMPCIMPGMILQVLDSVGNFKEETYVLTVGANSFTANFTQSYPTGLQMAGHAITGSVAANTVASISKQMTTGLGLTGSVPSDPEDYIQFGVQISDPLTIKEIKIFFDVGDGTFTQDYYYKSVSPSSYQPSVTGQLTSDQVQTSRVADRAAASVDLRRLGVSVEELAPPDLPDIVQLRAAELNTGKSAWTAIQCKLSEFVPVGLAGGNSNNWANVVGWKIQIVSAPNTATTVGFSSLALIGGAGPDSFGNAPYDYRYTFYNINTGWETNPSVTLSSNYFISPRRQPLAVTFLPPTTASAFGNTPDNSQFTHARIYRRGGTLTQAWYRVAQVPVVIDGPAQTYTDAENDSTAEIADQLEIDNDGPVTSVLRSAVNLTNVAFNIVNFPGGLIVAITAAAGQNINNIFPGTIVTVGSGANQEAAYVYKTFPASNDFQIFLQNPHSNGETVTATARPRRPMNLMAMAFDKAWLAGDPDNPHVLYYSKPFRPESFPPQNFIEVGTPDSPIMFMVALKGLLYVFTTKTVYQVLGAGSTVPIIIPTGVMHGAVSNFGWVASEGVIYYTSYDGVYAFQGASSPYLSAATEWIWTGKNLGPVPALDTTQKTETFMAYCNHEVYISYLDQNGQRHRQIYQDVYTRWRSDDQSTSDITAQYFEQDTGQFIVGKTDGMVYIDRVNDYDSGGFSAGVEIKNQINIALQTPQMDQGTLKAFKQYNNLTLDWDTNGQQVFLSLLFDSGNTIVPLGPFVQSGRGQTQININNGLGQRSLNVALLITGAVTQVVNLYEVAIGALVEAEFRRSSDSFWKKFGSPENKLVKQGYFEYQATQPVQFSVFIEGSSTARYTFTLPSTNGVRTSTRVRFPAVKAKLWRFVSTSTADYQTYSESSLDVKGIRGEKGYVPQSLEQETA